MSTTGISSATFPRKSFFCCFLKLSWSWVYHRCWNQKRFSICNYTTVRNCYAYSKITNDQKRGLRTILKTHFSIKMFRKKFYFFCRKKFYVGGLYAYAKYKKPSKTGLGTILKTHFSINRNFEQKYILCRNFRLIRPGGGVLRLRKVFP